MKARLDLKVFIIIIIYKDERNNEKSYSVYFCLFPAIRCENPGNLTLRNGSVITSDPKYNIGATLVFECNEGFVLKGRSTITCRKFGWDFRRLPRCKGRFNRVRHRNLLKALTHVVTLSRPQFIQIEYVR